MSSKRKVNAAGKRRQGPAKRLAKKRRGSGGKQPPHPPVDHTSVLGRFQQIADLCRSVFKRKSTWSGIIDTILAALANGASRNTITAGLAEQGRTHGGGLNKSYKHFERSPWDPNALFKQIFLVCNLISRSLGHAYMAVALDDTLIRKTGKRIQDAAFMLDPLGPKWRYNLTWGIRFLHAAFMIPTPDGVLPWPISVGFDLAPPVKKKRKRQVLTPEEEAEYEADKARCSITGRANVMIHRLRGWMDEFGYRWTKLLIVGDGSFTNGTIINNLPIGVEYIGRTRRNTKLYRPDDSPKGNKIYGERLPTPEEILKDNEAFPMKVAPIPFGGQVRQTEYKEVIGVLWPLGTKRKLLRLIVFRGLPRSRPRYQYSRAEPVYLLTTDLTSAIEVLGTYSGARWQIEQLHKDLKDGAGVGEPQCSNPSAVRRIHSTLVAGYSMLNIAVWVVHGPARTKAYPPLEKWRSKQARPSHRDKVVLLKNDLEKFSYWPKPMKKPSLPRGWHLDPRRTYTRT